MKTKSIAIVFSTALIGLCMPSAWSAEQAKEPAVDAGAMGRFINDSALTARVKAALAADDITDAIEIEVETTRGVVLLEGTVDSAIEKLRAAKLARGIEGVEGVMNKLTVTKAEGMGESSAVGQYVGDAAVTTKVKAALAADSITEAVEIEVATTRGTVTLKGEVDSIEEKQQASRVAHGVEGVRKVDNELTIAAASKVSDPGAIGQYVSDAGLTARVKTALAADSVTEAFEIEVETTRGVVLLSGQVDSPEEARQAVLVAQSIDGVRDVMDRLTVN